MTTHDDRLDKAVHDAGEVTRVAIGGAHVRVRTSGDETAHPVVLVHGIGRSLEDWTEQHALLGKGFRVISMDLPGFGLSDRLPGRTTLRGLSEAVLRAVDGIGERRPFHLMGNSLGGAVSMGALAMAPDRLRSLTLVNSAGFGRDVTWAIRSVGVRPIGPWLLRHPTERIIRDTERAIFVDKSHITAERLAHGRAVARHVPRASAYLEIAQELGSVRGVRQGWRDRLLAAVARTPRPTLVVWGDRDLILPARHLEAARAAFPHARTHLFERTGHMPQIERADEFASLATQFLSESRR